MKYLFVVILLFSSCCWGGAELSEVDNVNEFSSDFMFSVDTLGVPLVLPNSVLLSVDCLVKLYDEYLDSCYADSVEVSGWVFVKTEECHGISSGYDVYKTWWKHREPTFSGFIEFLRDIDPKD